MKTEQPTDLELQLFLAKELEEEIETAPSQRFFWWQDTGTRVTPREWDYICRKVEEKLTDEQWHVYDEEVCELFITGVTQIFMLLHAPWQTRAIALRKVLGKEGV